MKSQDKIEAEGLVVQTKEIFARHIDEVGVWSDENFGRQKSKWSTSLILGHAAPLLGIFEELGELDAAYQRKDFAEVHDAIGDVLIYMCDHFNRAGFGASFVQWEFIYSPRDCDYLGDVSPTLVIGELAHINLKKHQGIRNMDNDSVFVPRAQKAYTRLVYLLVEYQRRTTIELSTWVGDVQKVVECLEHTWEKIVKKRDWKKNQATGVEVRQSVTNTPQDEQKAEDAFTGDLVDPDILMDQAALPSIGTPVTGEGWEPRSTDEVRIVDSLLRGITQSDLHILKAAMAGHYGPYRQMNGSVARLYDQLDSILDAMAKEQEATRTTSGQPEAGAIKNQTL